jgi:hypothetical protein
MRQHWPAPLVSLDEPEPEIDVTALFPPGRHTGGGVLFVRRTWDETAKNKRLSLTFRHAERFVRVRPRKSAVKTKDCFPTG